MTDPEQDPRVTVALAALAELTDPADVGDLIDATEIEPGLVDLHFSTTMPGYVDWRWTVSTAAVGDAGPTVLEVQLLPGEGSLLAPPWVPWAERLAEWRRTHPDDAAALADDEEADEGDGEDLDEDGPDEDEPDDGDDDDEDDDDGTDEDPFEAAGVEVEDVVVEDAADDDVYGDSGEDDPADDDGDDGFGDDDGVDDEGRPFRPQRGGDRF